MPTLAPRARQILAWRAGLGTGRSYGRLQVARLLGTSVPRERALEQRAATELRTAARHGCAGATSLGTTMMIATTVAAGLQQALEPLAAPALAGRASSSQAPSPAVAAAHRARHPSRSHRPPRGQPSASGNSKPKLPDSGSGSPSLLIIALAGLGAAILLTPLGRKVMPHASPAATHSGTAELPQAPVASSTGAKRSRAAAAPAGAAAVMIDRRSELEDDLTTSSRADQSGDPEGAFSLGGLLSERGDLDGAMAAYRRATERGHPGAASNLGVLLERRGDVDGALDAYRTAAWCGDPHGAFNLGGLLAERGHVSGALAAYGRAAERGDDDIAAAARSAIDELRGQPGA